MDAKNISFRSLVQIDQKPFSPFNYLYLEFKEELFEEEGKKLDVVNGRHQEKTFHLTRIQNERASKVFFYKPITRYAVNIPQI